MSSRDFWFHRAKFVRVEDAAIDPATKLVTKNRTIVLDNEPCDLIETPRTVVVEGAGGRAFQSVKIPTLKLHPPGGPTKVPDENDSIFVNGEAFSVDSRQDYWDPGSLAYMGSELTLRRTERTDDA